MLQNNQGDECILSSTVYKMASVVVTCWKQPKDLLAIPLHIILKKIPLSPCTVRSCTVGSDVNLLSQISLNP